MKVDSLVSNLWIQMNYLRGFSDALQHPALATFIEETVDLIDKFEKEWPDEQEGEPCGDIEEGRGTIPLSGEPENSSMAGT